MLMCNSDVVGVQIHVCMCVEWMCDVYVSYKCWIIWFDVVALIMCVLSSVCIYNSICIVHINVDVCNGCVSSKCDIILTYRCVWLIDMWFSSVVCWLWVVVICVCQCYICVYQCVWLLYSWYDVAWICRTHCDYIRECVGVVVLCWCVACVCCDYTVVCGVLEHMYIVLCVCALI